MLAVLIGLLVVGGIVLTHGFAYDVAMTKQLGALLLLAGLLGMPLLWLPIEKRRTVIRKLRAIALGTTVFVAVFFLAGELILRLVFREGESFSSAGGPIVERFERDFKLNSFDGPSRGPGASTPKLPGGKRILVQGDSITWGRAVREEDSLYPSRLLAKVRERNPSVDMAVLARPGREIDVHLEQLRKWGGRLAPDVIVYQWYVNDIELDKSQQPRPLKPWSHLFFHHSLQKNSYLWFFLDNSIGKLLGPPPGAYEQYLAQRYAEGSAPWLEFERLFTDWAALAKELSPTVIVVLYPHMSMVPGDPPLLKPEIVRINQRMLRLCQSQGLVCIEFWKDLSRFDDSRDIMARPFDGHPSAEAHRVMAEALYETLTHSRPDLLDGR